jgi:hypothetical protein
VPYAQVLGVLEVAPWNGAPYNRSKPDGNLRQLVFGASGNGIVTYLILDDQRLVDVLKVQWTGLLHSPRKCHISLFRYFPARWWVLCVTFVGGVLGDVAGIHSSGYGNRVTSRSRRWQPGCRW